MRQPIIVQKYGGSSLASKEKIALVADSITEALDAQKKLCIVVSAMGHSTNDLIKLARDLNPEPPPREMDMLISCGERISMSLLAIALAKRGVKACSLTGSQSGIITNDTHSGAAIIEVRPERVLDAFKENQVVIIAGFQGVSKKKEITTLKRGGSDTTAVAMAAALRAEALEIYSDVQGVMDADPHVLKDAQMIKQIDHRSMAGMSLYGAKILAHEAANLAKTFGIEIILAKACMPASEGTRVSIEPKSLNLPIVSALSHLRAIVALDYSHEKLDSLAGMASYFLCGTMKGKNMRAYISNDIAQEFVDCGAKAIEKERALLTVHLNDRTAIAQVFFKIQSLLSKREIAIYDAIIGFSEIFLIIDDAHLKEALFYLHKEVILGAN
jgi:aspartokinase